MKHHILTDIQHFNSNRLPELLPLKYHAMSGGPFRFLRGSCHLFYQDLLKSYPFPVSPLAWICGDLHIENFGCYKGSNRLVYFDINDFDEAVKAPVFYELARLLVSVEVAAEEIGCTKKETAQLVSQLLLQYRNTLLSNKAQNAEVSTATGLVKKLISKVSVRKESYLLKKRTNNRKKHPHLLISDQLWELPAAEKEQLTTAVTEWLPETHPSLRHYVAVDAGIRIAGTGSIGVKRFLCLLQHAKDPDKRKLIDMKQAMPSVILQYAHMPQPAWSSEPERITQIQRMMQHVPPAFLSGFSFEKDWYVVKELQPTADKINIADAIEQPRHVAGYMADLGIFTASAQLRSSGRYQTATADELKEFAADGSWNGVLKEWSSYYAAQVKSDYRIFLQAWKADFFNTETL